jgi:hypothetical protein
MHPNLPLMEIRKYFVTPRDPREITKDNVSTYYPNFVSFFLRESDSLVWLNFGCLLLLRWFVKMFGLVEMMNWLVFSKFLDHDVYD